jgi:hypothetical protein
MDYKTKGIKMQIKAYKFDQNDINIVPLGDFHIGDKAFTKDSRKKLIGYIHYIKKNKNAYAFLMGDLINNATLNSPSSPFQQNLNMNEQVDYVIELLKPIKDKILGAITGNHENRLERYAGYNPTISICDRLGIYYFGYSGVVIFRLGCRKSGKTKGECPRASFVGYFHHTTGGGSTVGGKINRADKLKNLICNADFYAGAHNHQLSCSHDVIFRVNETAEKIEELRQMKITTGGYLEFNESYVESSMMPPVKLGSPRIHLFVKQIGKGKTADVKKDIHVSL